MIALLKPIWFDYHVESMKCAAFVGKVAPAKVKKQGGANDTQRKRPENQ